MIMLIFSIIVIVLIIFIIVLQYAQDKKKIYKDLQDKHVVITGGSSGIGKAVAIEAAKLGAHVTIISRDVFKLESSVKDILKHTKTEQKVQYLSLDVTADYEIIKKKMNELEANVGPIFMLVNCAGMCICGEFEKTEVEVIKQMIDLNYFGTAYPTRYVLPGMKERNEGLIVFVSTEAALLGIV